MSQTVFKWKSPMTEAVHIARHVTHLEEKESAQWVKIFNGVDIRSGDEFCAYSKMHRDPINSLQKNENKRIFEISGLINKSIYRKYYEISQMPIYSPDACAYLSDGERKDTKNLVFYIDRSTNNPEQNHLQTVLCFNRYKSDELNIISCFFKSYIGQRDFAAPTIIEIARNIYKNNTIEKFAKNGMQTNDQNIIDSIVESYSEKRTPSQRIKTFIYSLDSSSFFEGSNNHSDSFNEDCLDTTKSISYQSCACNLLKFSFQREKKSFESKDFKKEILKLKRRGFSEKFIKTLCSVDLYNCY